MRRLQPEIDMPAAIRAATLSDVPQLTDLLMQDAQRRQAHDPALWRVTEDARERISEALTLALTAEEQPFRQTWLVAQVAGSLVGVLHSMHLPVPPIYAGALGKPGLLLPEVFVAESAPAGTLDALMEAAEADLRENGAPLLLASFVCGEELEAALLARGYEPLTLYFFRSGLSPALQPQGVRAATEQDIDGIVARSVENRAVLHRLDPFWTPHPQADTRFGYWMKNSLTLADRDILVSGQPDALAGYLVAQPASRLHFPAAHDISRIGVIDDFFHRDLADPAEMAGGGAAAHALLQAGESALAGRGRSTAFVVCPAAWASRIALLEKAGYEPAMSWMIKR